jgi:hypothetical protein
MKKQFPTAMIGGIAGLVIGYVMYGKLRDEYINPLSLMFLGKPENIFGIGIYMVLYEIRKRILIYGAVGLAGGFVVDLIRYASLSGGAQPPPAPTTEGTVSASGSRRPVGVIVIAVLLFLGVAISLLTLINVSPAASMILAVRVPLAVMRFFIVIGIAVSLYCGIGLLKLQRLARTVYLWWAGFGVLNSILTAIAMANRLPQSMLPQFVGGMAVGLAFYVWVISYLVKKKDFFVK